MGSTFNEEMLKALEEDGEKLKQLTGEDHGPYFLDEVEMPSKVLKVSVHVHKNVKGLYEVTSTVSKICDFLGSAEIRNFGNQVGEFATHEEAVLAASKVLELTEL